MERTKHREDPKSFFSNKQTGKPIQGMQESVDNLVKNVNNFMIPKLREAGYDGQLVRNTDVIKKQREKEHEKWSEIHPRTLLKDKGWWLEIWPKDNPRHKMVVKPFFIKSTKPQYLGNRPRYNLCTDFLSELANYHQNIWLRTIWNKFHILDLHFLIMTESGMFWLDSFHSISAGVTIAGKNTKPVEWYLTSRNDSKRPDRIATKASAQEGKFLSIKKELRNRLLTIMYYWTKNNQYASK